MNLVKLQDDLKMLPMAVLQSKAQGQDPQVPPWLATAVLNERMDAQKKAGLAQGAKGEQPSIVEQLNQKAGLMALQGQQQQQAQQQMMQQMAQAPQPAPENVPQPEQQPEPQMMAGGGLARLPVNSRMFDYQAGGIISFQSQGAVPVADEGTNLDAVKAQAEQAIANLRKYGTIQQRQDPEGYQRAQQAVKDAQQSVQSAVKRASEAAYNANPPYIAPQKPFRNFNPAAQKAASEGARGSAQATGSIFTPGSQSGLRPEQAPPAELQFPGYSKASEISPELRAILEKEAIAAGQDPSKMKFNLATPGGVMARPEQFGLGAKQPASQPAAQPLEQRPNQPPSPTGIAALARPQVDPLTEAQRFAAAMPAPQKPTLQDTRSLRQQALREAGLPEDIGATLKEGVGRYETESERIRKERKEADALYALAGGTSESSGLGGIAQRSAERSRINALADTIRNDKSNEMRMAMEAARRAEAMGDVAEVRRQMDAYNKAAEEKGKAVVTAATNISNQKMQSESALEGENIRAVTSAARDATSVKVAKIQAAVSQLSAEGRLDTGEGKMLYQAAAKLVDIAQKELEAVLNNPMYRDQVPAKEKVLADAKAALLAISGGKIPTAPSAAPPPNRPPLGSFQK